MEATWGFPRGSVLKNLPANAGDTGDIDLIPDLGRSLEQGKATHSSILAWKIPWREVFGRLPSMGSQRVRCDLATKHARMEAT